MSLLDDDCSLSDSECSTVTSPIPPTVSGTSLAGGRPIPSPFGPGPAPSGPGEPPGGRPTPQGPPGPGETGAGGPLKEQASTPEPNPQSLILGPGIDDDDELDMDNIIYPWYRDAVKKTVAMNASLEAHNQRLKAHTAMRQKLKEGWDKVKTLHMAAAELDRDAQKLSRHASKTKSRTDTVLYNVALKKANKASKIARAALEEMHRKTNHAKRLVKLAQPAPLPTERLLQKQATQGSNGMASSSSSLQYSTNLRRSFPSGGEQRQDSLRCRLGGGVAHKDSMPVSVGSLGGTGLRREMSSISALVGELDGLPFRSRSPTPIDMELSVTFEADLLGQDSYNSAAEASGVESEGERESQTDWMYRQDKATSDSASSSRGGSPSWGERDRQGGRGARRTSPPGSRPISPPTQGGRGARRTSPPGSRPISPPTQGGRGARRTSPPGSRPISPPTHRYRAEWSTKPAAPTAAQLEAEAKVRSEVETLEGVSVPLGVQVLGKLFHPSLRPGGLMSARASSDGPEETMDQRTRLSLPGLPADLWEEKPKDQVVSDAKAEACPKGAVVDSSAEQRPGIAAHDPLHHKPPPACFRSWGFATQAGSETEGESPAHPPHHSFMMTHRPPIRTRRASSPLVATSLNSSAQGPCPSHQRAFHPELPARLKATYPEPPMSAPLKFADPSVLSGPQVELCRKLSVSASGIEEARDKGCATPTHKETDPLSTRLVNMSLAWLAGDRVRASRELIRSRGQVGSRGTTRGTTSALADRRDSTHSAPLPAMRMLSATACQQTGSYQRYSSHYTVPLTAPGPPHHHHYPAGMQVPTKQRSVDSLPHSGALDSQSGSHHDLHADPSEGNVASPPASHAVSVHKPSIPPGPRHNMPKTFRHRIVTSRG